LAEEIVDKGYFIGVTGQILHSTRVQNIVDRISVDSILTETDSPYLGVDDRNTPLMVQKVVEKIADLKNLSSGEVAKITSENSTEFFSGKAT